MAIQPTSSGQPNRADRLTERTPVERATRENAHAPASAGFGMDRIEVSHAARQLAGIANAGGIPAQDLSPERIREIAGRIASGFYDRPEVRDAVVGRLTSSS